MRPTTREAILVRSLISGVLLLSIISNLSAASPTPPPPAFDRSLPGLTLVPDRALVSESKITVQAPTIPAGAVLRYTTDGSLPTLQQGKDYTQPWSLDRSTLLRVAAFRDGKPITRVTTHSYLFYETTLHQPAKPKGYPVGSDAWQGEPAHYKMDQRVVEDPRYKDRLKPALTALPSLSVVCPTEDLFDESRGLYLNTHARGATWERACSLEWIETNGTTAFQIDCGLRMQGNTGRRADKTPKHSFRVLFKEQYGASKLKHRVFPDSAATKFDSLVLRADYNNAWTHWLTEDNERAQRIRDAWLKDSHRAMGWTAAHSRYVHLYLNGLYWGIYDIAERPDAMFAVNYFGGAKEDYDVLDDSGVKDGSPDAIRDRPGRLRRREPLTFEQAGSQVDLTEYIDYLLLNYYAGNGDWGEGKNWYAIRRRDGRDVFRYYVWDGEITLQDLHDDVINAPPRTPFVLARRLAADPEYRLAFADRVQKHCFGDGALTPAACARRWLERAAQLDVAIIAESARWGYCRRSAPFTRDDDWLAEQRRLLKGYFPRRTKVLMQQLREAGLYPNIAVPQISHQVNQVVVQTPNDESTAIYYTTNGVDPRAARSGDPSTAARLYSGPLPLAGQMTLKARARRGTEWSALVEAEVGVPIPPKSSAASATAR